MTSSLQPAIQTKTTLQLIDQPGVISWPGGGKVAIYFNLIEMQDFQGSVPGRKYSYGNLRFRDYHESSFVLLFLFRAKLLLIGGGIETSISLYGLNSFTVTSPIVPFRPPSHEVEPEGSPAAQTT